MLLIYAYKLNFANAILQLNVVKIVINCVFPPLCKQL